MSISTRTLTDDYSLDLNLFNWNNIFLPSFLNIDHQSGSLAGDATSLLILNSISFTVYHIQYIGNSISVLYMVNCNSSWGQKLTLPYLFAVIQDPTHWPMSTSPVPALSASFLEQLIFRHQNKT